MRKYYYEIVYQRDKYMPSKSCVYHGESVADAKLYAYATLGAYDVNSIRRVNKP